MASYFLLHRTDQGGGYVAPPGSKKSYTRHRCYAHRFLAREAAERDRCVGNEVIEEVG